MGKTRNLFKKIRDTKGTFHANIGTIKDRNGMDLTEAEDTKKRWQEYTEELHKKGHNDPYNHRGVITHLEPDNLECEVKRTLGSITTSKASGGGGIPVELFYILKDDAVKVLYSTYQVGKLRSGHRIRIPKKGNTKECLNYHPTVLISHASKVILKNPSIQTLTVHELRTFRCPRWILKRQRNQRSKCQHPLDHRKSKGNKQTKNLLLIH